MVLVSYFENKKTIMTTPLLEISIITVLSLIPNFNHKKQKP
ncbi:hypothetical protein VIBC2010_02078 [Vibrio caribbeanicus ATCC BAA-2122]|uniref:Uncharacterized protein n=1 Tax=Vibrio caribbeanicus ATCC BAA-2122 TaxID=796620 RepID=E3BLP6_9VIBR|nr:hypothetical protein VIBC2010_02078 [Vibrio caribbeanicus ATCC BAA-2122]